jgi:hypothetical protein
MASKKLAKPKVNTVPNQDQGSVKLSAMLPKKWEFLKGFSEFQ